MKHKHGSGESLYGGMVSDLRSGVLQTHQALEDSGILAKGDCINERYVYLYKFEICLQIEQKDAN